MGNVLCKTNKELPQDMLLGNLLFTNLIDMKIEVDELASIFKQNNIPEEYIRVISNADAFRRASSSVKNRTMLIPNSNGTTEKVRIEVDEVKNDVYGIKRIIGIKQIDEIKEDISYLPVGEVLFQRSSSTCIAIPYVSFQDPAFSVYKALFDEIRDKYIDWSVYHNKDTVKNIINRIIADTHPINLMPTGLCKFIPSSSSDLLYNLKNALELMSVHRINAAAGNNIMEIIPVIDTEEQRSLIEKNFTAEITDELFEFTQELREVLNKKNSLSTRTAHAYIDKFNLLKSKAQEYDALLGTYVEGIYSQITEALELVNDNTDV